MCRCLIGTVPISLKEFYLNQTICKPYEIQLSPMVDMPHTRLSQNVRMPTNEEKAAFAQRLKLALRRSPEPVHGPTELALRFNLRYQGNAVSAQTTHKWLSGRAIPTHDKLTTLAEWLGVNEHWLHYGPPTKQTLTAGEQRATYRTPKGATSTARGAGKPTPETVALAEKIQTLSPHRRYLVEELVTQLAQEVD
jgi:transcriptional regulator with XRE-family HTH domain